LLGRRSVRRVFVSGSFNKKYSYHDKKSYPDIFDKKQKCPMRDERSGTRHSQHSAAQTFEFTTIDACRCV
ncbi:hypothetical protein, partial [Burkholderia gladioli]|uniref:hypothetical protein n=1 Tax=Burkholderia gladioli TaxID=28095 RepID=UPI001ABB809D